MNPYKADMAEVAKHYSLDPLLVESISFVESSWRADAFRFEPQFYERYLKDNPRYKGMIPRRISSSYGLMQVMYPTAVDQGFKHFPEELFLPHVNLHQGCRYFKSLLDWAEGDVAKALAAYNGGKGNWSGTMPQLYARKVLNHYAKMKEAEPRE